MHPVWKAGAIEVIDRVSRRVCGRAAFITAARDGRHLKTSDHYAGKALDLRTRDLTPSKRIQYRDELQDELGPDYFVLYEPHPRPAGHIHISYRGP